jgi:beta-glucanase (GH16 family)
MQWSAKRSTLSALLVAVIALVSTVTGAFGQGAPVGGSGAHYALRNSLGDGGADLAYSYGTSSDVVLVGDWDGDGVDTLGLRRGKTYYLRNSHSGGNADVTYAYGAAGDAVLVGDWNGDGVDTLGVRRGSTYYLKNSHSGGNADVTYTYGAAGDVVLAGDWDGNRTDTLGVRRGSAFYLKNSHSGGNADVTYAYGAAGDVVLVGDWDGNRTDTLGVRRGNLYHLRNSHSGGNADLSFSYGAATDTVFAGDWDGNQTDTLGTRSPVAVTPVAPPTDTRLTFADEFNGAAGTPPDSARWKHDIGGHGWGNNELQYYTDSTSNAAHDGFGNMVITARQGGDGHTCHYGPCQFTSARLLTAERFAQRYGRFEARIKIPGGQGAWPAFWMLNSTIATDPWPSSGEIDVMENIGREPGTVWGSLHGPGYSGANAANGSVTLRDGRAFSEDFHVFAVDWQPDSVTWFVDGVPYSRKTPEDIGGNPWVVDDPFFLLLNLAIGGDWPGSPDATTPFPLRMLVDYVRVHAWEGDDGATAEPAYAIHGLAEK